MNKEIQRLVVDVHPRSPLVYREIVDVGTWNQRQQVQQSRRRAELVANRLYQIVYLLCIGEIRCSRRQARGDSTRAMTDDDGAFTHCRERHRYLCGDAGLIVGDDP